MSNSIGIGIGMGVGGVGSSSPSSPVRAPDALLTGVLAAWYDADDATTITLSGPDVTQWDDKETALGSSNMISGPTREPQIAVANQNGLDGINFGIQDRAHMVGGSLAEVDDLWLGGGWMIAVLRGAVAARALMGKDPSTSLGWKLRFNSGAVANFNKIRLQVNFASVDAIFEMTDNDWPATVAAILEVEYDNTNSANRPLFRVNGVDSVTNTVSAPSGGRISDGGQEFRLGRNAASEAWDGFMYEVCMYSTIPDVEDQEALRAFLQDKWAT